jgi:hypothetical protein
MIRETLSGVDVWTDNLLTRNQSWVNCLKGEEGSSPKRRCLKDQRTESWPMCLDQNELWKCDSLVAVEQMGRIPILDDLPCKVRILHIDQSGQNL